MKPLLSSLLALLLLASPFVHAREMGEPDLESDEFVKRFTASYGVLSEKEPPLDDLEIVMLKKVAPIMRVNKDHAKTFLQSMTTGTEDYSATFNYLLGNVYFENDEYLLAEEEYKKAIESYPDFQRAWTNLGVLKLRSGDTRSALIAFIKAVELGDNKPQTFGMLGYCHYSEGNYISAEVAYDRAMLAEPDNLDWLEGKAQTYLKAERWIEAIRMQDELISRRPRFADYWLAQTNAYIGLQDFPRAARNLEIVRSLHAADFHALFLLGSLYSKLGVFGPASDAYLEAAQVADDSEIEFLTKATKLLLASNQNDSARKLFERIDPASPSLSEDTLFEYHILAGDFAKLDNQPQQAIASYEKAEQLDPSRGEPLIKLARVYEELGERDKAYLLLDRAETDPDFEYVALVTRVKLLIDEKRFSESQVYVGRALKLRSDETTRILYEQIQEAAKTNG